jgi:organic hydroperoxide reductase OsmC/OhrA
MVQERTGLELASYRSLAVGKLERGDEGLSFTEILVRPTIGLRKEEDRAKAAELIERAEANCLISNSIKARVIIEPTIEL